MNDEARPKLRLENDVMKAIRRRRLAERLRLHQFFHLIAIDIFSLNCFNNVDNGFNELQQSEFNAFETLYMILFQ